MAGLSENERVLVWSNFMQRPFVGESIGITKADLRAAINDTDSWIDDNQGSFNAALPQPARSSLSAKQKVKLFLFVVQRRFDVEV